MSIPIPTFAPADNHFLFVPARYRKYAPYLVLALAVFIAYGNVYGNAFLYDDESLILKNAFLRSWDHIGDIFTSSITAGGNVAGGFYRPMQIFLYLLVFHIAGISSFAFHFLNVSLHAANACLMYRFGRKLRFNPTAVFFATLLWALHPVQVEAVTYVSGTADPLYAFFMLLGMVMIVPRFKLRQILASIPLFILALLSKEEASVFPLLAMSCVFLFDQERFKIENYLRLWPLGLIALGACANDAHAIPLMTIGCIFLIDRAFFRPTMQLRLWPLWLIAFLYLAAHHFFLDFGGFQLHKENDLYANSILCRTYTFLAALPSYFVFTVWPVHLHYDRDFQPVADLFNLPVMEGVGMIAIAAAQIILGRNRRAIAFSWGVLWFAAADLPHTGIPVALNASLLEHWLYLPSVGLFLGTAQSLASVKWQRKQRKPFALTMLIALTVVLGVMTWEQNRVWHDAEGFYLNIFKNGEPSPHAHNNLGIIYALDGRYDDALEQFQLSIDLSGDANPQSQHDLAITLLNGPDGANYTQEAMTHLERALEIDPDYYPAAEALAALYDKAGDHDKAEYYRQKAAASHAKMIGP